MSNNVFIAVATERRLLLLPLLKKQPKLSFVRKGFSSSSVPIVSAPFSPRPLAV